MKDRFDIRRALAVANKEVMHILRDPFTLAMSIGIPVILVVFFGFAIDLDFRGIRLSLFDEDHSYQSRELTRGFSSTGYFSLCKGLSPGQPADDIEQGRAHASLIIPPGFGRDVLTGRPARAQILVDGSDNQRTGVIAAYIAGVQKAITEKLTGAARQEPVLIRTRFLYNPELNTQWFVVPGLIVVVIGLLSILMTALTVAREWENGSMELLLATPVRPFEVVLGKLMPYAALGLAGIGFVFFIARSVFGVPFRGSYFLLVVSCLLFTTASLAQGLLISVIFRQQQKAMQASMIAGLLPSLLLSGFIFPVESMPPFFQYFTMILPPRWFMTIVRTLFLKGTTLEGLALPFAVLALMNAVLIGISVGKFKKDVEP